MPLMTLEKEAAASGGLEDFLQAAAATSSRATQVNFLMEAVYGNYRKLRFFVESWVLVHPITGKKRQYGGRGALELALKIIRDKLINKLRVVG